MSSSNNGLPSSEQYQALFAIPSLQLTTASADKKEYEVSEKLAI